jgi:hypothetical protein
MRVAYFSFLRAAASVELAVSAVRLRGHKSGLQDTLRNQPFTHLALVPLGVGSVLDVKVVVLHQAEELVAGGRFGVNDTVLDEPLVDVGGRPGVVDGVGGLGVGDPDVVEERSAAGGSRGGDDIVLLEPGAELVVIP